MGCFSFIRTLPPRSKGVSSGHFDFKSKSPNMKNSPTNHVRPPAELSSNPNRSSILDGLYTIEPVTIRTAWDDEEDPLRVLQNPTSSQLFELLSQANLKRATVFEMTVSGQDIGPRQLARLNWSLHIAGFTKGFRKWKIDNQNGDGGSILWKSKDAYYSFKEALGITAGKTP
jgi:hypothetical protein